MVELYAVWTPVIFSIISGHFWWHKTICLEIIILSPLVFWFLPTFFKFLCYGHLLLRRNYIFFGLLQLFQFKVARHNPMEEFFLPLLLYAVTSASNCSFCCFLDSLICCSYSCSLFVIFVLKSGVKYCICWSYVDFMLFYILFQSIQLSCQYIYGVRHFLNHILVYRLGLMCLSTLSLFP